MGFRHDLAIVAGGQYLQFPLLPGDQDEQPVDPRAFGLFDAPACPRTRPERVDRLDDVAAPVARSIADKSLRADRDRVGAEQAGLVPDIRGMPPEPGAASCPHTTEPTIAGGMIAMARARIVTRARIPRPRFSVCRYIVASPLLKPTADHECRSGPSLGEHPIDQLGIIIGAVPAIVSDAAILGEASRGALAPEGFDHGAKVEHSLIAIGVTAERPDRQRLEPVGGLGFAGPADRDDGGEPVGPARWRGPSSRVRPSRGRSRSRGSVRSCRSPRTSSRALRAALLSVEPADQVRRACGKTTSAGMPPGRLRIAGPSPTWAGMIPSSPRSPAPWRNRITGNDFEPS